MNKYVDRTRERTKTTLFFGPRFGRALSISWRRFHQKQETVNGWVEVLAIYALLASTVAAGCWYLRR